MKNLVPASSTVGRVPFLYHFSRLQLAAVALPLPVYAESLRRMFAAHQKKVSDATWDVFLEHLHIVDAFLAAACLARDRQAWEALFAARTGRSDQILVDALRARALRLYPRDVEKQDSTVADFWGHLIVPESAGAVPILARYDGQRPLIPWLIRIFHNWQISRLRSPEQRAEMLADDDHLTEPPVDNEPDVRWHESFCEAARMWLHNVSDQDALVLGLRMRYRMSQREVAKLLGVHEGTISRQITDLRDRCLEYVGERLQADGWTGADLDGFVHSEMAALLLDEPRLAADRLARLLAAKGKALPT
jgi:RNA polymerase sigma factor (sigma-70 family)